MTKIFKYLSTTLLLLIFLLSLIKVANAETTVSTEIGFIFNTLLLLICGVMVMLMSAGFAMLEAGMVTSKSVSVICAKNIGLYAISGIMFLLVGYNLAYGIPEGGYIGSFKLWSDASLIETGYSDASDWFFQMVFCATAVSICSGAMAERVKLWPFFLFACILSGIVYPIVMGWQWGGGWLSSIGFADFAGSTLVHATGGAAALAGIIVLGPRNGRFGIRGEIKPLKLFAASSVPLVTIGVFILWFGWFGFNGGSRLALGTFEDAVAISKIFVNTNLAACGGVVVSAIITRFFFKRTDVIQMLNGALGGLVAITAEPLVPSPLTSILIGAVGGLIVVFGTKLLLSLKLDDVVGAVPVHLFSGIWGTLAVPFTNTDTTFTAQIIGVLAVTITAFIASFVVFFIMKVLFGLRLSKEAELIGTDVAEAGVVAYAIRD